MDAVRIVRRQAYELICSAKPVDGGKFAPSLVVSKQLWPRRPRVIDVPRGNYLSAEVAIDAAESQGVEWVQNFG